jgi:hypothetical protein
MKRVELKQYAKLRQHLLSEKAELEARLTEINQVLGDETPALLEPVQPEVVRSPVVRRGRRRGRGANAISMREAVIQALARGPLTRKDLVPAVEALGFKFETQNPLNSIGSVLYGKNSPVKTKNGKVYLQAAARSTEAAPSAADTAPAPKPKRTVSPEGKARIAAAQRARWAKQKAAR